MSAPALLISLRLVVLAFPAAVLLAPDVAEVLFDLLAVCGVVLLWVNRKTRTGRESIGLLAMLTGAFFAVALLSVLISDDPGSGIGRLDKYYQFLAAPLLGLLLFAIKLDTRSVTLALKFSAFAVLVAALVHFSAGDTRAGGEVNALVFGTLSLFLGFFSMVRYPLESGPERLLSLLAFCAGSAACVMSQARGGWITAIFLFAAILYVWHRAGMLSVRTTLSVSMVFSVLVLVSSGLPFVQDRVAGAVRNYQSLLKEADWESSVGRRLVMWGGGLESAGQRPLTGWGFHRTQQAAASVLDAPDKKNMVLGYTHLHNEYITTLVGKGLIGLLGLLAILFIPLVLFTRPCEAGECMTFKVIGTLLCIGYAVSGLTNLAFGHELMNMFFVFFLALTLPRQSLPECGAIRSSALGERVDARPW